MGLNTPSCSQRRYSSSLRCAQVVAAVWWPPRVPPSGGAGVKKEGKRPPPRGGGGKKTRAGGGGGGGGGGQDQRQPAVLCVVQIMVVVQRHQRVQPGHITFFALLPVQPPKVHALFFIGLVEHIKVGVPKGVTAAPERNILLGFRVQPHRLSHGRVRILKGAPRPPGAG